MGRSESLKIGTWTWASETARDIDSDLICLAISAHHGVVEPATTMPRQHADGRILPLEPSERSHPDDGFGSQWLPQPGERAVLSVSGAHN
eukprot:3202614-Pyramimonas_sp.AAC.1